MFFKETDFQETEFGIIPREWDIKKAVELGEVITGITPSTFVKEYWNGDYPFVTPTDMTDGKYVEKTERKVTAEGLEKGRLIPKDSVLVTCIASIGKMALAFEDCLTNQQINTIICRKEMNPHYVYYAIGFRSDILKSWAGRTTNPIVKKSMFEKFPIPVPSYFEQTKIAEVLSCVDLAIQKTDEVIAKTELLKKGLMQKLLTEGIGHRAFKDTEIGKIPKEWEVTSIDDECIVGTGGTPSRTNPQYYGGKIPWVKSTEVDYCIIRETGETLTEYGLQNSNAKIYPTGSLAIALYGQGVTRGKCAIFGIDAAVNQACAVVQSKGQVHIPFLFYWFQKSYSWIRSLSQGANQSNLNMAIIRSLKFPLPSRLEQERIAEILSTLDNKLGLERDQRTRMGRVKLGLMDLLLTGKVRVRVD